jgi:hypothetical protein
MLVNTPGTSILVRTLVNTLVNSLANSTPVNNPATTNPDTHTTTNHALDSKTTLDFKIPTNHYQNLEHQPLLHPQNHRPS